MPTPIRDALHVAIVQLGDSRRNRSAFGYAEPKKANPDEFAQCGTCELWIKPRNRCYILSDRLAVDADDSCIQYIEGEPIEEGKLRGTGTYSPEEVGFFEGPVRCENCRSFADDKCQLFQALNAKLPDMFDLEVGVSSKGCCNAFVPQ